MELSLAERLRFEKLLSSLAAAFSHLSAADFDPAVQRGLRQVVDFLGVDRGSLIEFTRDGIATRSWAVEEWMDVGEFPWMTARLQRGEVINVSQIEELPGRGGGGSAELSRATGSSRRSRCPCW